jgi:hypothetical protein
MTRAARPILTRVVIGCVVAVVYVVGGGSLLSHVVSGAATASDATVFAPPARVIITLSVGETGRTVMCETDADRVSSDTLLVPEFDLVAVYKDLGCQAPPSQDPT